MIRLIEIFARFNYLQNFRHFQMVSAKFYNDYDECDVFASSWAKEGDMDVERLKQIEILFLNAINWNVLVSKNEFYEKLKTVEKILALKEGLSRGWMTYTELEQLMPSTELIKIILSYTRIIVFSYMCSIAAIALSGVILTCAIHGNHPTFKLIDDTIAPQFKNSSINIECNNNNIDENFEIRRNYSNGYEFTNVLNWDIKRNYQHMTNFYVPPTQSFESVPVMMRLTTGWNG